MERAFERRSNRVKQDAQVSTTVGKELVLWKKTDQLMKELKQMIIGKEEKPAKEMTLFIEARAHMSEGCDARGKQETDDLAIECLALAYQKNPHINDETFEWILWTWEMKERLEKEPSEELVSEYEKVEKEMATSSGSELNLAVKENNEKGTTNGGDDPGSVADLLKGLSVSMDDNNIESGSTPVKKVKKLVDIYAATDVSLNLEEGKPKRTPRGQAPSRLRDYVKK